LLHARGFGTDHGFEQRLLVAEMSVDRHLGNLRRSRDVLDRGPLEPAREEQRARRTNDRRVLFRVFGSTCATALGSKTLIQFELSVQ
jgi:hypothetical protein